VVQTAVNLTLPAHHPIGVGIASIHFLLAEIKYPAIAYSKLIKKVINSLDRQ
jgi:hypothetical protein